MRWSFTDKLIIFAVCVLQSSLLSGSFVAVSYVVSILMCLIILFVSELKTEVFWAYGVSLAAIVTALFMPGMVISFPLAAYALAASPLLRMKQADITLRLALAIGMMTEACLVTGDVNDGFITIAISVVAFYMAFRTVSSENYEAKLRDKFDDARQDSLNARRLGEEIMKNADNEVYTAKLKERNRIAREIHDNVGHMITRVIVQMQAIKIINKDEKVAKQLDSVSETLDIAMTGIRKSVHELHDDSIDLSIAINDMIKTLPESFDVEVTTSIESPADNATKSTILGIIKEAVTNLSKYSKGSKALIEVVENNTFWRVKVWDNGPNPMKDLVLTGDYTASEGMGLKNIASRAKSLGGRASVRSGKEGFEVIATLPKKGESK